MIDYEMIWIITRAFALNKKTHPTTPYIFKDSFDFLESFCFETIIFCFEKNNIKILLNY